MNQRTKSILYVLLIVGVIGLILLVWAYDTGKLFTSADIGDITITSSEDLQSLPAPDKSTFGDFFGKIADWFQ